MKVIKIAQRRCLTWMDFEKVFEKYATKME
jgi:hypothetical protein